MNAVAGAQQYAHEIAGQLGKSRQGRTGDQLIGLVISVVAIAMIGAMGVVGLSTLGESVNNSDATTFVDKTVDALMVLGDFMPVIVVFGVIGSLFGLIWWVRRNAQVGQTGR